MAQSIRERVVFEHIEVGDEEPREEGCWIALSALKQQGSTVAPGDTCEGCVPGGQRQGDSACSLGVYLLPT